MDATYWVLLQIVVVGLSFSLYANSPCNAVCWFLALGSDCLLLVVLPAG
jgi:hypothetical protein